MERIVLRRAAEQDAEFVYRVTEDAMRGYVEATWGRWNPEEQREFCRKSFSTSTHKIVQLGGEEVGVRPPIRICIESAGLNVHLLPDPFSSEDRL